MPPPSRLPASPSSLVQTENHLFTQGKEQKEPIALDDPTDTEDTKSEKPLTAYQMLLIDVHQLMNEAAHTTAGRKAARAAEQSVHAAQDAAAKAAYNDLSTEDGGG